MRHFFTLLIPLTIALLSAAGCYTILKHPATEEGYTGSDYQRDCLSCHPDYHSYPYGYFYGDYPNYWWSTPRYGHYYAYPWWWDNYWYDSRGDNDFVPDTTAPQIHPGTKEVRRDALRPPYTYGTSGSAVHQTESTPPPPSGTNNVSTKTTTPENKPDSKKDETKKDENKESTKEPRRGGGPGR